MRPTPGDIASQLQELASRSLRQHVRNNQRFADLLKRISAGQVSMEQVRDELRQFSEQETAEYIRTLTTMGVNFFSGLLELNQSYNERFFQRLGQAREDAQGAPPRSDGELVLRGSPGEVVQGRFVVENQRGQISDVAISISPVTSAHGTSFRAPFVIEPAAFRLGAGEERSVALAVRLHPELFRPGELYLCQLTVRGPQDMLLEVRIEVAEEAAETEIVAEAVAVEVEEAPARRAQGARTSAAGPAAKKARRPPSAAPGRGKPAGRKAAKKSSAARKRVRKQTPSA